MNQLKSLLFAASAVALAGCASTKELTLNQPVGPAPQTGIAPAQEGFIQVYSARERAVVDPNMAEFRMNNDLGRMISCMNPPIRPIPSTRPMGRF